MCCSTRSNVAIILTACVQEETPQITIEEQVEAQLAAEPGQEALSASTYSHLAEPDEGKATSEFGYIPSEAGVTEAPPISEAGDIPSEAGAPEASEVRGFIATLSTSGLNTFAACSRTCRRACCRSCCCCACRRLHIHARK